MHFLSCHFHVNLQAFLATNSGDTMTTQNLQAMIEQLLQGLPDLGTDVRQYLNSELQRRLRELNLVTREEFDIQAKVLARSREKLNILEQHVTELEQKLKITS